MTTAVVAQIAAIIAPIAAVHAAFFALRAIAICAALEANIRTSASRDSHSRASDAFLGL